MRLGFRSESLIVKRWVPLFATKVGVDKKLALQVYKQRKEKYLCSQHTVALYGALKYVEQAEKSCSVCCYSPTGPDRRKVTDFPWARLRKSEDTACVIEDSVALYTDNTIRPSDINWLCDACRRVICRPVVMTENVPHDEESLESSDSLFDPGPTRRSIRACIRFVRRKLWDDDGSLIVFLSQVREKYDSIVSDLGEQEFWLKDNRSLKKYMLPSLAATGIFLEIGSRKIGSFFCTTESLKDCRQRKGAEVFRCVL